MLRIENIDIGFHPEYPVFTGISATVSPGDMIALLGVNGIGKSSLLRTIAGLQLPLNGAVFIGEEEVALVNSAELAKWLSIVTTERIYIDNITVREFVAMGRAPHTGWFGNLNEMDIEVIERTLKISQLDDMQDRMFNRLSDGEKQRVLIARAICQDTPILILDEPSAYLDFRHKKNIYSLLSDYTLQNKETMTIFSTHDIQAALKHANTFWLMTEEEEFVVVKNTEPDYEKRVLSKLDIDQPL